MVVKHSIKSNQSRCVDTKPPIGGGGAGDSVFLVWSVGRDQPVLPGGHWFSVFTLTEDNGVLVGRTLVDASSVY